MGGVRGGDERPPGLTIAAGVSPHQNVGRSLASPKPSQPLKSHTNTPRLPLEPPVVTTWYSPSR